MLGASELAIILVIILVIFGAGKLPEVFTALGKGMKSFREAQRDDEPNAAGPFDVTPRQISKDEGARSRVEEAHEVEKRA
jgi:sec-independent protein translocase protein TatA